MRPSITLNPDELQAGAAVGARRHIQAIHRPDKNFPDRDNMRWQTHIEGALAEIAVAKYLDRYWSGCGLQSRFDVANVQARSILQPEHGLVIRESDSDEDVFILIHAHAPIYVLLGWTKAGSVKIPEYRRSNDRVSKPFWIMPTMALSEFKDKTA